MRRKLSSVIMLLTVTIIASISCTRDNQPAADPSLYGSWKTSYGDTITFSKENGKDILTYNMSLNAVLPVHTKKAYSFQNDKLSIHDGPSATDFRTINTFKWQEKGRSFEVQGIEWFMFLSSTATWFTFTKI
jgi:hypothetical protein